MAKRMKMDAALDHGSNDNHAEIPQAVPSRPAARVECPREGEIVSPPSYTFRIAATPGADHVVVSIDQGVWKPCREALGVWRYDWSGYGKGRHDLVARCRRGGAIATYSDLRRFSVE